MQAQSVQKDALYLVASRRDVVAGAFILEEGSSQDTVAQEW
jgi:hypothetical protein